MEKLAKYIVSVLVIVVLIVSVTYFLDINISKSNITAEVSGQKIIEKNDLTTTRLKDVDSQKFDSKAIPPEIISTSGHSDLDPSVATECIHNKDTDVSRKFVNIYSSANNEIVGQYEYEVSNLYSLTITKIYFGQDSHFHFFTTPSRLPAEVLSPAGWNGLGGQIHESEYFRISWFSTTGILPGTALSGFKIHMKDGFLQDEEKFKDLVQSNGKAIGKISMEEAPFTVEFSDGSCYWSTVQKR